MGRRRAGAGCSSRADGARGARAQRDAVVVGSSGVVGGVGCKEGKGDMVEGKKFMRMG